MKKMHPKQSVISDDAYIERKGSMKEDTIKKLKDASKRLVSKPKPKGTQGTLME